jgi:8-oxo-dGTP pyrophosphatase MutT (NUDIX family)
MPFAILNLNKYQTLHTYNRLKNRSNPAIPDTLTSLLNHDIFLSPMNTPEDWQLAPKFRAWKESIDSSGCTLHVVKPLALTYKRNNELLFAFLETDITTPEETKLVSYCFIRGSACIIVPLLRNRQTGVERFLMVRQRRIGHGRITLEFPAGMLDHDINDPRGVAIRELFEETGLSIEPAQLFELFHRPLSSSAGASDEMLYYFGCTLDIDDADFCRFDGRQIDDSSENEHIHVALKTAQEAQEAASSIQVLLGLHLFLEKTKRQSP